MAPHTPKLVVRSAVSVFFEYDTPKIVHIRSKKVGIINRLIQLGILGYLIGFAIVWKKGYQEFDTVKSAVTTKVKGIIFSNNSDIGERTWDVADYIIPPQEANAFFVMTNVIPTLMQQQKECPEDPTIKEALCTDVEYCQSLKGTIFPKGNGVVTGNQCINSTMPGYENKTVCTIFGWCPVEDDKSLDTSAFDASRNFTVFIKNNIEFPKFGVTRRNLPDDVSDEYLNNCRFDSGNSKDKYCPIFRLETIVEGAGIKYDNISKEGGVMQIVIDWTCNLDYSEKNCQPEYSFRRLDKGDYSVSKGFNFRYADHFAVIENGTTVQSRNLYKAFGIRFLVTVQGSAGKFNLYPTLLTIGSGVALFAVSTVLCDMVVLYVLKARHFYKEKKYLDVKGQDAFEVLDEEESEEERMGNSGEGGAKRRNLNKSTEYGATGGEGQNP